MVNYSPYLGRDRSLGIKDDAGMEPAPGSTIAGRPIIMGPTAGGPTTSTLTPLCAMSLGCRPPDRSTGSLYASSTIQMSGAALTTIVV